jgi:hypothetical protein
MSKTSKNLPQLPSSLLTLSQTRSRAGGTKKRKLNNKTNKKGKHSEKQIVLTFLEMLNCIKLYHWKTFSYATHKATDELYSQCNDLFDQYVEIMLGKTLGRVNLSSVRSIPVIDFASKDIAGFRRNLELFSSFLLNLEFKTTDSDLATIRDEILAKINQFLYLSTFSK